MERKIGEIFEYNGEWYQCVENDKNNCEDCDLTEYCDLYDGVCDSTGREDGKSICFKKLEKVGEPFERFIGSNKSIKVQRYRLPYRYAILPKEPIMVLEPIYKNSIEIEIKQTKEGMEENYKAEDTLLTRLVGRYVNNLLDYKTFEEAVKELYSNKEENEPTLKEFDIEAAKAGKPVCTRDGGKARIICFDKKCRAIEGEELPIVALLYDERSKREIILDYTKYGKSRANGEPSTADLMMLPEKHEGWTNIYKTAIRHECGAVFDTEQEARGHANDGCVATINIEWEE